MKQLLPLVLLLAGCSAPAATLPPPVHPPTHAPVSACRIVDGKADRRCTPGKPNPQVTQGTLAATVCRPGWTSSVRPPAAYTNQLKTRQMVDYGLTDAPADYEEDHLIPLGVGGDPRSPDNLYPQPWDGPTGAYTKDGQERALQHAVCAGQIPLVDAQQQIVAEWSHP